MSDWAMEKAREVLSSAHPQENIYAVIARAFDAIRDEAEARGRASMKGDAAKVAEAVYTYHEIGREEGDAIGLGGCEAAEEIKTAILALS